MRHAKVTFLTISLSNGFRGKSCSFEHRPFLERSPEAREAYLRLQDDLLLNGMKSPLITYKGHVLIGMRRFEIMQTRLDAFPCLEILEDVPNWTAPDIKRLQAFKRKVYGAGAVMEFMG